MYGRPNTKPIHLRMKFDGMVRCNKSNDKQI